MNGSFKLDMLLEAGCQRKWDAVVNALWPDAPPCAREPGVPNDVLLGRLEALEAHMVHAFLTLGQAAARPSGVDFIAMVIVADSPNTEDLDWAPCMIVDDSQTLSPTQMWGVSPTSPACSPTQPFIEARK